MVYRWTCAACCLAALLLGGSSSARGQTPWDVDISSARFSPTAWDESESSSWPMFAADELESDALPGDFSAHAEFPRGAEFLRCASTWHCFYAPDVDATVAPSFERLPPIVSPEEVPAPPSEPGLPTSPVPSIPLITFSDRWEAFKSDVCDDYANFYQATPLLTYGMIFAAGGVIANTNADADIYNFYRRRLSRHYGNPYSKFVHGWKHFGTGHYAIPILLLTSVGTTYIDAPWAVEVGNWSQRSLRGMIVGVPPLLALQYLTGGSRPREQSYQSHWRPFQDTNGVSGHAFMGAIPFLTLAAMTDRPGWKVFYYSASFMTGLSRIEDRKHYPSQVLLGWSLAWFSVHAVNLTERNQQQTFAIVPACIDADAGVSILFTR